MQKRKGFNPEHSNTFKEEIKKAMPKSMTEKFSHVTCIIDCVEFKIAVPSSLVMHKVFYSSYKSHTTGKCLVGIVPGGGFSFISSVFPGSITDKEITVISGLLDPKLFKCGDGLMADRKFTIKKCSDKFGIDLIITSFLEERDQLSAEEVITSQQIANE